MDGGNGSSGLTDLSSSRRRPPGSIFVNGRWLQATPAQQARFEIASARARDALRLVRERDPNWRLQPGVYGTGIESEIRRADDIAAEALARVSYLQSVGIGPGPFAGQSIPARGPDRNFMAAERREINCIWNETGCHTCGTFNPGTKSGNPVLDHQPPNKWNHLRQQQRLFPQCQTCSRKQGSWISHYPKR